MFTGHQWDGKSGLYYAPFRYYSPFQARWTTRDPLGMVDGPNVYAYVRGNPVNAVDVWGLFAQLTTCETKQTQCLREGLPATGATMGIEAGPTRPGSSSFLPNLWAGIVRGVGKIVDAFVSVYRVAKTLDVGQLSKDCLRSYCEAIFDKCMGDIDECEYENELDRLRAAGCTLPQK